MGLSVSPACVTWGGARRRGRLVLPRPITSARSTVIAAELVVSVMLALLRRVSAITNRTSCTDSYMMTLGNWNDHRYFLDYFPLDPGIFVILVFQLVRFRYFSIRFDQILSFIAFSQNAQWEKRE